MLNIKITAEDPATGEPGLLCAEMQSVQANEMKSFACRPGTMGRIVKIQLTTPTNQALKLCEVEVHGGKIS